MTSPNLIVGFEEVEQKVEGMASSKTTDRLARLNEGYLALKLKKE